MRLSLSPTIQPTKKSPPIDIVPTSLNRTNFSIFCYTETELAELLSLSDKTEYLTNYLAEYLNIKPSGLSRCKDYELDIEIDTIICNPANHRGKKVYHKVLCKLTVATRVYTRFELHRELKNTRKRGWFSRWWHRN